MTFNEECVCSDCCDILCDGFFFLFANLIMVKVKVSFTREQAVKAQKGVDE